MFYINQLLNVTEIIPLKRGKIAWRNFLSKHLMRNASVIGVSYNFC